MRYSADQLDQLADDAVALCEDMRTADRGELYERIAGECRDDPERMAQLVMCLAAWVDVDDLDRLPELAEEIDAFRHEVAQREAPPNAEPRDVLLRRDISTPTGVLPRNTRQRAIPVSGGQWQLLLGEHTLTVPETWIKQGAKQRTALLVARDAREEYDFATRELGYSHAAALQWLREKFKVCDAQLDRWGLLSASVGVAS